MRPIDADALNERFKARRTLWFNVDEVLDEISDATTIDAEPVKRGKFIGTKFDGYNYPVYYEWICSECGCVFEDEEPTYNYCPNCGARMEVEE